LLTGTIAGLERGARVEGPVLDALCNALQTLFDYPESELRAVHLQAAPLELVVELDRLAYTPGFSPQSGRWQPAQLADLLTYLPAASPLALYGRALIWVYLAAVLHAQPARCHQFDPRLGWVTPTAVRITTGRGSPQFNWSQRPLSGGETLLEVTFAGEHYLDYAELKSVQAPALTGTGGLILSGRLPLWLLTGLALAYRPFVAWLAVDYPPLAQAVVVAANDNSAYRPGDVVSRQTDAG
jgi:CRISPR-associated protein Csx3